MLAEFGQAPVCLELDLNSYDGPWTHVERFRARSGWLMVADACLTSGQHEHETSVVVACDEWGEPVPSFMAPNLLACACSFPMPCSDYPPDELEELLRLEGRELKRRWLRENNMHLSRLHSHGTDEIAILEGRAARDVDSIDKQIADIRRRRRLSGVSESHRRFFDETIVELEQSQDAVVAQLTADRAVIRHRMEQAESDLIAQSRIKIEFRPAYQVNWFVRPERDEVADMVDDIRNAPPIPRDLFSHALSWPQPSLAFRVDADRQIRRVDTEISRLERRAATITYSLGEGSASLRFGDRTALRRDMKIVKTALIAARQERAGWIAKRNGSG